MEVSSNILSEGTYLWLWLGYVLCVLLAIRLASWRRLLVREQWHVFLGSSVALMLLWHVRVSVDPAWSFHLLGVTAITLMFGWALAIVIGALAETALVLNGVLEWQGFALNALLLVVVPVTLTQFILVLVRSLLPKHFFVYILVNAFLTAGLAALTSGLLASLVLLGGEVYAWSHLQETLFPFFPLMFLPEAIINGWLVTILVLYRPDWVVSFDDRLYLQGR
ncbi:MAG: energy-coupling factor ABC transporter permease [Gammaproteobacteria bacterium]|nr:energy-coupling factor ABC transporter permease [Gammaproteobacteria bacterium]